MMATFASHTILGAGISLSLGKLVGLGDHRLTVGLYGAITGMFPDVFDWVMAKLGLVTRWNVIYDQLHNTWKSKLWAIIVLAQPPLLVGHFLPDKIFHANSPNWWPRLWWLEISMWLIGLYLSYWGLT